MKLILIIPLLLSLSCSYNPFNPGKFADKNEILKNPRILKIEYYQSKKGQNAIAWEDKPVFTIENKTELKKSLDEIRNADNPGMWKGAGWDQLKLYFSDTIVSISTNETRVGFGFSGEFYALPEHNFISKRIK